MAAIEAVAERYRAAIGPLGRELGSAPPVFSVMERVEGNATTDFGAPDVVLASDRRMLEEGEPERLAAFLDACWTAFDAALAAVSADVRGVKPEVGRSPDGIRSHLLGSERGYLAWVAKPVPRVDEDRPDEAEPVIRDAWRLGVLALPVGVPFAEERRPGPYAVRRQCWHVLDHAWELADRGTQ